MDALPDIHSSTDASDSVELDLDIHTEIPSKRKKKTNALWRNLRVLGKVFHAITLVALIAVVTVLSLVQFYGEAKTRALFGLSTPEKTDLRQQAIEQLQLQTDIQTEQIISLGTDVKNYSQVQADIKASVVNLQSRSDVLEKQLDQSIKTINGIKSAQSKPRISTTKKVSRGDSSRRTVPTMTLISVRIQGGMDIVTLKSITGERRLLMVGDNWKGWRLLNADPDRLRASFDVNGKVRELML